MSKPDADIRDVFPLPEIHAFRSYKKAKKAAKKSGFNCKIPKPTTDAITVTYSTTEAGSYVPVCLIIFDKNGFDKMQPSQRLSLLCHECFHVFEHWLDFIRTDAIPDEVGAYFMEACLMVCIDQIGFEWFTKTPQA